MLPVVWYEQTQGPQKKEYSMAKSTEHAGTICLVLTLVAAAGALFGFLFKLPLLAVIGVLPAAGYELYRTEGPSTRLASLLAVAAVVALIFVFVTGFQYDVEGLLRSLPFRITVPAVLFSLPVALSVVLGILAAVLFLRTRGKYTRWLAVVIFASALIEIYLLIPDQVMQWIPAGARSLKP